MHYAASLDAPLEGAEDFTLQDMILDHMAEEDYRFIEKDDFWHDGHELLEEAIMERTSERIQEAFPVMLERNCKLADAEVCGKNYWRCWIESFAGEVRPLREQPLF